ncbi:MAG: septum formation protein Maf [Bacteriovoracaceae bacterium]|nr:septum formation protein Maf [Bacteriovoracaceae bacterium]
MTQKIILASTSKYRKELLLRLNILFDCVAPEVDEDAFKELEESPVDLAEKLAAEKARAVSIKYPDAIVIGGDQVATIDGEILGKPGTPENAKIQLTKLSGNEHVLVTSICIRLGEREVIYTDRTFMRMRELSADEIDRYINHDSPLDCAGSYKLESLGISLFKKIEGIDHTAIQGLPLMKVAELLKQFGIAVP